MKKNWIYRPSGIVLFLLMVLCSTITRAQTIQEGEYFIDVDPGPGNATPISFAPGSSVSLNINVPTGILDPGIHHLSVRFRQDNGAWGITGSTPFAVNESVYPFVDIELTFPLVRGEYFFDADPGIGNGTPFYFFHGNTVNSYFGVTLTGLTAGEHRLGTRVMDLGFRWSVAKFQSVLVVNNPGNLIPVANFTVGPNPQANVAIPFTNTSQNTTGSTIYQWDINNNQLTDYSTANISHTFTSSGIYPVRMTAINPPSALAQTAKIRYYFTNGSLVDAGGTLNNLVAAGGSPTIDEGRQGDMSGSYKYGPARHEAAGGALSVSQLSLTYWFKGISAEAGIRLFDNGNVVKVRSTNGVNHTVGANSVSAYAVASDLYDGNWHHVAITWIPGTTGGLKSYLDGQLVASANTSASAAFTLQKIVIGGIDATTYSNGLFDDILFYNQVLTATEVQDLYAETYASTMIKFVEVSLPPNNLGLSGPAEFCSGDTLTLTGPPGSNYLWSTGETTSSIEVAESGSYMCAYIDATGTPRLSSEVLVTVHQSPQVDLTVYHASDGLANGSAGVAVIPGESFQIDYLWSNGKTTETVDSLLAGNYSITVDDGQCPVILPVQILNIVTPGQIVAAEYFLDSTDPGAGNAQALNIADGNSIGAFASFPLGNLPEGTHRISVRVQYANGLWSTTRSNLFSVYDSDNSVNPVIPGGDVVAAEYFYDAADPGPGNGSPIPISNPQTTINESASIDLAGVAPGYHRISVRTQNELGHWSTTHSNTFLVDFEFPENLPDIQFPLVYAEYFIGTTDPGVGNGIPIDIPPGNAVDVSRTIDISALAAGTYKLNFRTRDITGHWSATRSKNFDVVVPPCQVPDVSFVVPVGNAGVPLFFDNTSLNVIGGATTSWDIGVNGSIEATTTDMSYNFPSANTYDVALTVNNGGICVSTVIQQVDVGPLLSTSLIVNGGLVICENNFTTLTAPAGGSGHIWSTGETTTSIQVYESGSYFCFYIDANGHPATSNVVGITVHPAMDIDIVINNATNGQANGSAGVIVTGGSSFTYDYLWSTGDITPIVTQLSGGNYTVNVSDGVCPQNIPIVIANVIVPLNNEVVAGEYFWGNDPGVGNGSPIVMQADDESVNFADLSTTGLTAGFHVLSVRVRDAQHRWGITRTMSVSIFDTASAPVPEPIRPVVMAEYFFDEVDPGPGNGLPIAGITSGLSINENPVIDISSLIGGNHTISVRVRDEAGRWSPTRTRSFFIIPLFPDNLPDFPWPVVEAEYFFDNVDPGVGNGIPVSIPAGISIGQPASIDVSALTTGNHKVSLRVRDVAGHWSVTKSRNFEIIAPACPVPLVDFTTPLATVGVPVNITNISTNVDPSADIEWDINANGSVEYTTTNITHTFTSPGTYNIALTIDNGGLCVSTLIQQIVVGPVYSNLISANGPLSFCEGGSVTLTAPAGTNRLWSTGAATASIVVTTSGVYQCVYTNPNGIVTSTNSVNVVVWPLPDVVSIVNQPTNGNANGSIGLLVSGGSAFLYDYDWSNGATTPIIVQLSAGNYSVEVSDGVCPVNLNFSLVNQAVVLANVVVAAEYFWDLVDPGPGDALAMVVPAGDDITSFANIPTTGLSAGYHKLSVRTRDSEGEWSVTKTIPVHLFPPIVPVNYVAPVVSDAEFFFDNADPGPGNANPLAVSPDALSITEAYSLDCSLLGPGAHRVSVRVRDAYDQWSITRSGSFNLCFPPNAPVITSSVFELCSGSTLGLSATNPGTILYWTAPNGVTHTGNTWSIPSIDPSYSGTFTVYSEGVPGCFSSPTTFNVHVEVPPATPSPILGPTTVCVTDENAAFFIEPIPNAENFDWNLPSGTIILSGNNTNNILVDFSDVQNSPAVVSVEVSNDCGSVVSAQWLVELTCLEEEPCPGDFDNNGVVNIADLLIFMASFGCPSACGPVDMDGNGPVNISDLLIFMASYGTICP